MSADLAPFSKRRRWGGGSEGLASSATTTLLQELRDNAAQLSRGQNKAARFEDATNQQLEALDRTAQAEGRHLVPPLQSATRTFCKKSVHNHKYHVIKCARNQCPAISQNTDKTGSVTRGQKVSATRTAALQFVDAHNVHAIARQQHFVVMLHLPTVSNTRLRQEVDDTNLSLCSVTAG